MLVTHVPDTFSRARGQAVIETALILPLLILISLGVVEFGLIFHNSYKLTCATRECARIASMGMPAEDVSRRFRATTGFKSETCQIQVSYPQGRKAGNPVLVRASYSHNTLTPVMGFTPIVLRDSLAMSLESN
ncbi:MAG: hypothetical protein CVV64_04285 [Candidatus Wallbacteria bacterium HGW-Wallbacteria-1]|jgi:Flp pilus assembly protein TadG|uniref:TadE-like domain-containing protein n=1 Tax=Candidatus Wallbacteria bacterium HGW-Wallbacteria-1 TaxID=2013854 RepID=A0A2N1PRN8_9BACT|nr:MAG: hypothetical protein CVV64_04285 [Candidatus Wallbacteria bacterium HGW-Wallbacteria-1]